ncbi:family 7 extracellular solute-binding protein [Alcanivorax xiamenensis]|uniref:Family 7 extracellular solute-binding protein n=1 Tax=Alcanivorax xiamenensis TaxID=1177156 RepID=A0ABQ6YC51_9GAMM|nr:C4-dicarboxylate TRAP transporter substrate-binding protein [Alcanivorax xiamenensis]KAF0807644.1 family 7 extracellular solute-binding protein [Alcanivorax xiamenensis]
MLTCKHTLLVMLSGILLGLGAMPSNAEARELRYAIGQPPKALPVIAGEAFAKAVGDYTEGELTVKVYALSLLSMAETSAGLRDGIADVGFVLTPYFPAEYPHNNMLTEASMLLQLMGEDVKGREGMAFIPALSEYIFQHCDACLDEFKAQNQVFTGLVGGSSYGLVCNTPITNQADMAGKRFRVGAANWSRWVKEMGGTPITMSANEMLEALSQGVVDCIVLSTPEIDNFGLAEAVTDISMGAPGGIFSTAGQNVNRQVWQKLSDDQRGALLRAAAVPAAMVPYSYHEREKEILGRLQKKGIKVHDLDPDLLAKSEAFITRDMDTIAQYYEEKHGVENGAQMLKDFRVILEKWVGLTQGVDSLEEYQELYWNEVFSKVDPSTYGLQ